MTLELENGFKQKFNGIEYVLTMSGREIGRKIIPWLNGEAIHENAKQLLKTKYRDSKEKWIIE